MTEICDSDPNHRKDYQGLVRLMLWKAGISPDYVSALGLGDHIVEIETLSYDGRREKRSYYLKEFLY